ncbi:MAG: cation:proton antiporter [Methylotenera sp.]|nr:cation:proton antiporter [Oligoflexia bacterium]
MNIPLLLQDLAVILGVAGLVTLVFQRLKQPLVLGYLLAGLLVGPHFFGSWLGPVVVDPEGVQTWAELGVIFLMFSLGLEFSFQKLKRVGPSSAITASFEVIAMVLLGFATGRILGWNFMDSLYLGAMIAISSTTIIVKSLQDLGLKTRRFAEMILGVLIVEDLFAILLLVALSTLAQAQNFSGLSLLIAAAKLLLVVSCWFLSGYLVLPRLMKFAGKVGSEEVLTVLASGFCLGLAIFAAHFGYSVALGAFIMGSILAESTESHRIEELVRPLRDVFAAVFFVSVGMLIDPRMIAAHWGAILIITFVAVIGKALTSIVGALMSGQSWRMSVQVGLGLAQIGEFSFIIAAMGLALKVTSDFIYPVAVAVSILTTLLTPYRLRYSHKIAVALEDRLPARFTHLLARYSDWRGKKSADSEERKLLRMQLTRWLLSGIVVTGIFLGTAELMPETYAAERTMAWAIAALTSSPFLWAMFFAFGKRGLARSPVQAFLTRVCTLILVGILSLEYFAFVQAAFFTLAGTALVYLLFFRQLNTSYRWFEKQFLSTFDEAPKTQRMIDVRNRLAPWDAHLVRLKVHPNSIIAGKSLRESGLRGHYQLNVVVIKRGSRTLVAPTSSELIFPQDELLVLGVDEQIDQARDAIEFARNADQSPTVAPGSSGQALDQYELKNLLISETSPLVGVTIRESRVREQFGGIIVGIERGKRRILNPNPDLIIELSDILWIVGQSSQLKF